jgi:site-specific DNA recombinase
MARRVPRSHRLTETIEQLEAAQTGTSHDLAAERAKQRIADANAKLARHRAALEAGADPAVVTTWIAQTQADRRNAEAQLREATCRTQTRMSRQEITTLVESLGSLLAALREADPADKAEVYQQLELRPDYQPDTHIVQAQLQPSPHDMCRRSVSEDRHEPPAHAFHLTTKFLLGQEG